MFVKILRKIGNKYLRYNASRTCDSQSYYESLKNIYKGRRGFVIGNGPSLKLSDLELLKNEITIASNKIYLSFDYVSWRPSFYTVADPLLWDKIKNDIPDEIKIIHGPDYLNYDDFKFREKLKIWHCLGPAGKARETNSMYSKIDFSVNLCEGMYSTYTITFENLQLASYLGLSPIYIIGCDHYYSGEKDVIPNSPVKTGLEHNHFMPNYRMPGEMVNPAPIDKMNRGLKEARLFSDHTGIEIINATRGGYLEIFPRANFDTLFIDSLDDKGNAR